MLPADQLNELGNQGWELCGIRQRGQGAAYYYFKREKLTTIAEICEIPGGPVPTALPMPTTTPYITVPPGYTPATPAAPPQTTPTPSAPPAITPPDINGQSSRPIGSTGVLPSDEKSKDKSERASRSY
jgi:hypothetical protein